MAINLPDIEEFKEVEDEITKMAEETLRSKTKMTIILLKEAIATRKAKEQKTE